MRGANANAGCTLTLHVLFCILLRQVTHCTKDHTDETPKSVRAFAHDKAYNQVRQLRVKASTCHDLHNKLFDQGLVKSAGSQCAIVRSDSVMRTWLACSLGGLCEETAHGVLIATIMHAECYASWGHPDSKEEISFSTAGAKPVIHARACTCLQICNLTRRQFGPLNLCNCRALFKDNVQTDHFSAITIPSCMMANVRIPRRFSKCIIFLPHAVLYRI